MRLDATHDSGAGSVADKGRGQHSCLECGAHYAPQSARADFCGTPCRRAWNNRRMVRGAELYDLFMATRFNRELVGPMKLWRLLNRIAAIFRDEDNAERAGRASWRPPQEIIERRPYLRADYLVQGKRRRDDD